MAENKNPKTPKKWAENQPLLPPWKSNPCEGPAVTAALLCANVALFISPRINKFYLVTVLMKSGARRGRSPFLLGSHFNLLFWGCPRGKAQAHTHVSPPSVCLYSSRNRNAKGYCIFTHTHTQATHPHTLAERELRSCQFAFLNLRIAKSILSVTTNIYPAQGSGPAVASLRQCCSRPIFQRKFDEKGSILSERNKCQKAGVRNSIFLN